MYPVTLPNGKTVKFETKEEIKEWVRTLQIAYVAAFNEEQHQKVEAHVALLKLDGIEYVDWEKIRAALADHYPELNDGHIKLRVGRLQRAFLVAGPSTGGRIGFDFRCALCGATAPTRERPEFHNPGCGARYRPGYRHLIVSKNSILDNETAFSELEDVPHIGQKTKDDYAAMVEALQ